MEKKRRARINESLQELRTLLADTDVSTARTLHFMFTCPSDAEVDLGSDRALLLVSIVSFQDGERRGAGDDGEKGGGHTEEPNPRSAQFCSTHSCTVYHENWSVHSFFKQQPLAKFLNVGDFILS